MSSMREGIYKGMNPQEYREKYLCSPEWKTRRDLAIGNAGNRCQICNSDLNLDVHHRTYENIGNEKLQDLTVLCRKCHGIFHGKVPQGKTINLTKDPKDGGVVGIHFIDLNIDGTVHIEIGDRSLYALYDALRAVENIPETHEEDRLNGWYEYNELLEVLEEAIYCIDNGEFLLPKVLRRIKDNHINELKEKIENDKKDLKDLEEDLKIMRKWQGDD